MPDPSQLTERQARWFQSVRDGLERDSGRTLDQWAQIARGCPEQAPRARLAWMKANHGLGQNHASMVLNAAFPTQTSWSNPDELAASLWSNGRSAQIFAAIRTLVTQLPQVVVGQRKSFTAFSRKVQFAAARPIRTGGVMLGLALDPACHAKFGMTARESWSERLKSTVQIADPAHVDNDLFNLLGEAWQRS